MGHPEAAAVFRFRLDPVLKARRREEQERQRAVADIERERIAVVESLRRQQRRISETRESLRERLLGTLHAPDLRLHAGAVLQDMRRAQQMTLELAAIQRRLDAARAGLTEAMRSRRAIELLRERRLGQWRAEQRRAEQRRLDELATSAPRKEPGR